MLHWIALTEQLQIDDIKTKSAFTPQVVFKHSTRCNISSVALKRLENAGNLPNADYYYLDLIKYRHLSDAVAHIFEVYHESPQILVIKNGECVYDESHLGIDTYELTDQVVAVQ
jgi:bacillithiol system protein YtxJ